jgi:hypothetical protein
MVARDQRELPSELRQFYPELARNYFQVVATWYEKVRVGAQARAVVQAVDRVRNRKLYDFAVNPGHYLHLDEWVHSPFTDESEVRLRSGMMLQMDIIPVSRGPFCCTNAEDGIVLADDTLQQELENSYPEVWRRIVARREFMRTELNIQIHDSLLPLSNIPGWLPPFAMDLNKAFVALAERRGGR